MKKHILLLAIFALLTNISSFADVQTTSDYKIIETTTEETIINDSIIFDMGNYKVIQLKDNYYTLVNADGDYIVTQDWENFHIINEELKLVKLTKADKFIFFNGITGDLLMYPASDFTILSKNYLRIYKDGKYGLIDTYGNQILDLVYERIGITTFNDKEYIVAKQDGKNNLYYETGNVVPEEDLYDVSSDASLTLLAKDIKSIFKANYLKLSNKNTNENELTTKVEELNVEKNEILDEPIKIKNKAYYLTNDGIKIGLRSADNKRILPAEFDKISIKNLSSKFSTPVLLTEKESINAIYSINGKLLAEEKDNKINVYKYGKTFTYTNSELYQNEVKIGNYIANNDELKFEKSKFIFVPIKRINELILTILHN